MNQTCLNEAIKGVPIMAQRNPVWLASMRTQVRIPGLAQWVKDPALLWAVVQVEDVAWTLCCCGCGIAGTCSSNSALVWRPPYAKGAALKSQKKKFFFKEAIKYLKFSFNHLWLWIFSFSFVLFPQQQHNYAVYVHIFQGVRNKSKQMPVCPSA